MNLQDLEKKARTALYKHHEPTTLNRWIRESRGLKSEIHEFNRLVENYEGLNRPLVLN